MMTPLGLTSFGRWAKRALVARRYIGRGVILTDIIQCLPFVTALVTLDSLWISLVSNIKRIILWWTYSYDGHISYYGQLECPYRHWNELQLFIKYLPRCDQIVKFFLKILFTLYLFSSTARQYGHVVWDICTEWNTHRRIFYRVCWLRRLWQKIKMRNWNCNDCWLT